MSTHPAVKAFVHKIQSHDFGGAAEVAEEEIKALKAVIQDSKAEDAQKLAIEVEEAVKALLRGLHSLAPPINALHRVMGTMEDGLAKGISGSELQTELITACENFITFATTALKNVAEYGAELISDGDKVFTYSMSSTVWGLFRKAKEQGKLFSVTVTESRPSNEGFWTVTEMEKYDIPVAVSIDAAIGELVPQHDSVFIGADAISSTGVALCKTGSYPTALIAYTHGVPFYIAADSLKFDPTSVVGLPFRPALIERDHLGNEDLSKNASVVAHYFDETPPHMISAIITEIGLVHPTAAFSVMREAKLSQRLNTLLLDWNRGQL